MEGVVHSLITEIGPTVKKIYQVIYYKDKHLIQKIH